MNKGWTDRLLARIARFETHCREALNWNEKRANKKADDERKEGRQEGRKDERPLFVSQLDGCNLLNPSHKEMGNHETLARQISCDFPLRIWRNHTNREIWKSCQISVKFDKWEAGWRTTNISTFTMEMGINYSRSLIISQRNLMIIHDNKNFENLTRFPAEVEKYESKIRIVINLRCRRLESEDKGNQFVSLRKTNQVGPSVSRTNPLN